MAERPEYFPEWAVQDVNLPNTGNINKQRPKETLRTIGFDKGQEISAEEFNWMFNNMGQWVEFLEQEITVGISSTRDVNVNAGNGLQGGGSLAGDVTISMGTPSTITGSSTNSVSAVSHSHAIDQASTTQDGIVRLATNATVVTGTNTTQAATPSGVQAKLSSVSFNAGSGLVGGGTLNNAVSVSMGTPGTISASTSNSVTSTSHTHSLDINGFFTSSNQSLMKTGYQILPGGLILQWGERIDTLSSGTITLPIAFPDSFLNLQITDAKAGVTDKVIIGGVINNNTSFTYYANNSDGVEANPGTWWWFAIGF